MYIKVKAFPGSKKELVEQISEHTYKVAVKPKAERNMANTRIIELLSQYLHVSDKKIKLVTGHRSPNKILDIMN